MSIDVESRPFEPGTTGWSVADFDDPQFERLWERGRFELIEGVISSMPPAYFSSNQALARLTRRISRFLEDQSLDGEFSGEVDFIINSTRVVRCDAVFTTAADRRRQLSAQAARTSPGDSKPARLLIVPTLIVESISLGHERHDRELKRDWYAQAGVANYWIFDAVQRSVEAFVLRAARYEVDCIARSNEDFCPALFPGLSIPLRSIGFSPTAD